MYTENQEREELIKEFVKKSALVSVAELRHSLHYIRHLVNCKDPSYVKKILDLAKINQKKCEICGETEDLFHNEVGVLLCPECHFEPHDTVKHKTFLECMFNDLNDIHEGNNKQVKKELIKMGIDIDKAQKRFQATLAKIYKKLIAAKNE